MPVKNWPSYLLRGVPPRSRALLSARAEDEDMSVADVIRGILCRHYRLDCPTVSSRYEPARDHGGGTLTLRLQPELWMLLKKDTRGRYGEMRRLILTILEDTLEGRR